MIDEVMELSLFLREHYPPCQEWTMQTLLNWVRWHIAHDFLGYVRGLSGSIVGLALGRPIAKPEDAIVDCKFDDNGPIIYLNLCIALVPGALRALWMICEYRFGQREQIAFVRRNKKLHLYPYARFLQQMKRDDHKYLKAA
jgi:hypothetical protein